MAGGKSVAGRGRACKKFLVERSLRAELICLVVRAEEKWYKKRQ